MILEQVHPLLAPVAVGPLAKTDLDQMQRVRVTSQLLQVCSMAAHLCQYQRWIQ
jgi:hypothetical protein